MEITGLDGKKYKWNLAAHVNKFRHTSDLHKRARDLIKDIFPYEVIIEEIALPGSKIRTSKPLYCDFYIPSVELMIEVHGEQHYKYNSFFFDNKIEYYHALKRDKNKKEWCRINNITIIELPYSESDCEWRRRINDRYEMEQN